MQTRESMQRVKLLSHGCLTHTLYDLAGVWDAIRKNIISDRFSTKTAISAHI